MNFKRISITTLSLIVPVVFNSSDALVPENSNQADITDNTSLNFKGQNKYETSILISQNTFDSSKNVVIISGDNYIDNFPATTLASTLDAPILLVDSTLQDNIINEIKRLKATNVYTIGIVSNEVLKTLSNDLNLNVKTFRGRDRFETSLMIATEINKYKPINEAFIIGPHSQVDSISLGSIAAKIEAPIIYSHSTKLTPALSDFLKDAALDKLYIIGNSLSDNTVESIRKIHKDIDVIKGNDRYELNSLLNSIFYPSPNGIYYVDKNNIIDSAPLSISAAKKNFSVMLVHKDLTVAQRNYLTTTNITSVGSAGNVNKKPLLNTLNSFNNISSSSNPSDVFSKEKVVFYIPHQGDETLYFSPVILNAINTLGSENVFLALITDGNNATIQKSFDADLSKLLKNSTLDIDKTNDDNFNKTKIFTDARDNEFLDAAKSLGIPLSNVKLVNGISENNLYEASDYVKSIITEYEVTHNSNITHVSFTPYYDDNKDNLELGNILESLYLDRKISHTYFLTKDSYSSKIPDDKKITIYTEEIADFTKLQLASDSYKKFDLATSRLSIGYKSNEDSFKKLNKDIKNKSITAILHIPSTLY